MIALEFVMDQHEPGDFYDQEKTKRNLGKLAISTLDSYRRYLTVCTYLVDRVDTIKLPRGIYQLATYIPNDLSLDKCKASAYGNRLHP